MALKATFEVEKQRYDTEARVIISSADAEASQLVSDAVAKYGPGLVVIRKIEAA